MGYAPWWKRRDSNPQPGGFKPPGSAVGLRFRNGGDGRIRTSTGTLRPPTRGLANRRLAWLGLRLQVADRARPDRACPLSQYHSLSKRSRLPIPAPILLMAEGAGYDPADAVADATGVRDRRNYSVSAIPPRFLKWRSKRDSHPQEFLTSTGIQSRLLDCFEHCSFNGGHGGIRTRRKRALNAPRLPVAPHVRDGRAGGIRTRTALHLKQVPPVLDWATAPSENLMSKIVKKIRRLLSGTAVFFCFRIQPCQASPRRTIPSSPSRLEEDESKLRLRLEARTAANFILWKTFIVLLFRNLFTIIIPQFWVNLKIFLKSMRTQFDFS